jgi:hypothetical protein
VYKKRFVMERTFGWRPSTDVMGKYSERHTLYPRRPNRWSIDRGYIWTGKHCTARIGTVATTACPFGRRCW